jgi:hypothetical protein
MRLEQSSDTGHTLADCQRSRLTNGYGVSLQHDRAAECSGEVCPPSSGARSKGQAFHVTWAGVPRAMAASIPVLLRRVQLDLCLLFAVKADLPIYCEF